MRAVELENEVKAKKRVLRKGMSQLPFSLLIELVKR